MITFTAGGPALHKPFDGHSLLRLQQQLRSEIVDAPAVDVGEWHAMDVKDKPELVTHELQNVVIQYSIPAELKDLQKQYPGTQLEWAEEHFGERVSGEPLNPPPSHERWMGGRYNAEHQGEQGAFSHSYPERFWPAWAGAEYHAMKESRSVAWEPRHGIRFPYGDYGNILHMLYERPDTRQAYLPIWFPEDLCAADVAKERVPCTLGYHFLLRRGRLHLFYPIRSCDLIRYWPDDIYMACRLVQHTIEQLRIKETCDNAEREVWVNTRPGTLTMWAGSLHVFAGDLPKLRKENSNA
jgi:thymidylate synthase